MFHSDGQVGDTYRTTCRYCCHAKQHPKVSAAPSKVALCTSHAHEPLPQFKFGLTQTPQDGLILSFPEIRSGQEVCFRPVQARSWKIRSGTRMGPGRAGMAPTSGPGWVRNTVKTKRMANLDGTTWDPGWDLDGPRIGPRRGSGWHPQKQ